MKVPVMTYFSIFRMAPPAIAVAMLAVAPLALLSGVNDAAAQEGRSPGSNESIQAENAMVGYINKVDIPAEVQGALNVIKIEEGMTVKKDDLIATVDDSQAKLALDVKKAEEERALMEATNDINLKDAINSEKIARTEAKAYEDLHKQGATPFLELQKKRLEAERGILKIDLAERQKKMSKVDYFAKRAELRLAEDEVQRREIRAPFDGFIEKREAQLGQWVQPGSPIATLVQMDRLKVIGDIDALRFSGRVMKGLPVTVEVYHSSDSSKPHRIDSKIAYVSSEIDLNNRYRIWVEIPNTPVGEDWLLRPGMRAEITITAGNGPDNSVF
ncbi:efflux RND transporter periplasmic adaptor subunit [Stieleria marina]|uniref:Multidrug resistance protein MdtN n=1 Tax=Stieleria marina TaxID=1930275 RepID=A0A517NMI7_9BACT|nr:multidrug resistance protein MdtN [Planctomycetes bacterium K23_9]